MIVTTCILSCWDYVRINGTIHSIVIPIIVNEVEKPVFNEMSQVEICSDVTTLQYPQLLLFQLNQPEKLGRWKFPSIRLKWEMKRSQVSPTC